MKNGNSKNSLFLFDSKRVLVELMKQTNIQCKLNMRFWLENA